MNNLELNMDMIIQLCRKYNVDKLYAFGSVLTNRFNDESDIDFLVNFKDVDIQQYANNYFNLKFALEELLNREIDLLEESALKNPYFIEQVMDERKIIYG